MLTQLELPRGIYSDWENSMFVYCYLFSGMRPLIYSEKDADLNKLGWVRHGHHIRFVAM